MKIASAQIKAKIGDIEGNLNRHLEMIDVAITNQAELIVFPEMSLTGYCREEGKNLTIEQSNPTIIKLKEISDNNNLVIVVGAPIEINECLYIGEYILIPNKETEIYTKQFLHKGEDEFYSSSFDYNPTIRIQDEIIQFAICADIANKQHAINARNNNCSLYVPSIFYSKSGIEEGHKILSEYAKTNSMQVLLSNYSGNLWEITSGGKSGFWDRNGNIISKLSSDTEGLLLIEKIDNSWTAKKFEKIENALQH